MADKQRLTEQTLPKVIRQGVAKAKGKTPAGGKVGDVFIWDDKLDGFGLRVFGNGRASFVVRTSLNRATLGAAVNGEGELVKGNLARAREDAERLLYEARGATRRDTIKEAREEDRRKARAKTLGQAVPDYLDDREHGRWNARGHTIKPRSFVEIKRQLEADWKPLHGKALEDITDEDVVRRRDAIARGQGTGAADRAMRALQTLYVWAYDKRIVRTHPFIVRIKQLASNGKRDRTLSPSELREVWLATEVVTNDDFRRIVRLLALTGQRRDEIGALQWTEVVENGDGMRIELPKERTKNLRHHTVPLSPQAMALLPARRNSTPMVFGRDDRRGFLSHSTAKRELDAVIAAARREAGIKDDIPPWRLHDLRRTFATLMREKGFADTHLVELIINHVSGTRGGVAGVYDRSERLPERRAALEAWGQWVEDLVAARKGA
jgi:integrase